MMKLGEAAGRRARANVEPPTGIAWADAIANRNWLIHQYDEIDRRAQPPSIRDEKAAPNRRPCRRTLIDLDVLLAGSTRAWSTSAGCWAAIDQVMRAPALCPAPTSPWSCGPAAPSSGAVTFARNVGVADDRERGGST